MCTSLRPVLSVTSRTLIPSSPFHDITQGFAFHFYSLANDATCWLHKIRLLFQHCAKKQEKSRDSSWPKAGISWYLMPSATRGFARNLKSEFPSGCNIPLHHIQPCNLLLQQCLLPDVQRDRSSYMEAVQPSRVEGKGSKVHDMSWLSLKKKKVCGDEIHTKYGSHCMRIKVVNTLRYWF